MMSARSIVVALVVVAVVLACAALGAWLRERLPQHHLDGETKDSVKAAVGLLATLTALLLGLILASAKASFESIAADVQSAAAKVVQLDDSLRDVGPAADPVRAVFARLSAVRIEQIWGQGTLHKPLPAGADGVDGLSALRRAIAQLRVDGDAQRAAQARALTLTDELRQIRFLAVVQHGTAIMMPLLVLIVFWYALITLGLNLFAPRNGTVRALNVLCALSFAGAIFMILEMEQPYGGVFRVSPEPMLAALHELQR